MNVWFVLVFTLPSVPTTRVHTISVVRPSDIPVVPSKSHPMQLVCLTASLLVRGLIPFL
jgi:hypothetical protein